MKDKEDEIKAYMEAKMTHIKMYNECMNLADGLDVEKFAELVRVDEREKVAQWMMDKGFATGHGDSIEDLLKEIEWQVAERERTAVIETIDELMGMERDRHPMFSEGYDYALDHIKQFVLGRDSRDKEEKNT